MSNAITQTVLLQKLAKIRRIENEKSQTMAPFFFKIWIWSNIFRDISGCRCLIFILFTSLDLSFHQLSNAVVQTGLLQKLGSYGEKKTKSRKEWLSFSSRFGFGQIYFAISQAVDVRFLVNFFH